VNQALIQVTFVDDLRERNFIDCGGIERTEKVVNFQRWESSGGGC
jgi:hypothetical protein